MNNKFKDVVEVRCRADGGNLAVCEFTKKDRTDFRRVRMGKKKFCIEIGEEDFSDCVDIKKLRKGDLVVFSYKPFLCETEKRKGEKVMVCRT